MKHFYIILLVTLSTSAFGQYYPREFGIRGGYTSGFTFRVNLDEEISYEGQLGYRDNGAIFAVIRQKHQQFAMDRYGNWDFVYGFGPHVGFYITSSYRIFFREIYFGREIFTPVFGFNGYMGIEYNLVNLPVSFGMNFQPHMEISLKQLFGINLWDFGFNVRYRF